MYYELKVRERKSPMANLFDAARPVIHAMFQIERNNETERVIRMKLRDVENGAAHAILDYIVSHDQLSILPENFEILYDAMSKGPEDIIPVTIRRRSAIQQTQTR
jgi:hypothetical protein